MTETPTQMPTGAEALVHTLIDSGIDTCFANPGTSEMHFVAALDRIPGIRCVLGLQENTVTGMADGFFRVTRRPAATLLHCGPGLANGIANLHNARRGGSGMVNIVGDHAIPHVKHDSPLTSDVEGLARASSDWHAFCTDPGRIGADAVRAVEAARAGHGQVATLVLPADVSWTPGGVAAKAGEIAPPMAPEPGAITRVARALRSGKRALILLGTPAVTAELHPLLAGLAKGTGATLMGSPTISAIPRGRGLLALPPVPYPVDDAIRVLEPFDLLVLVNCPPPVGFFRYPGRPSLLHREDADVITLSRPDQDAAAALRALADELGASEAEVPAPDNAPSEASGAVTAQSFGTTVARLLPEGSIVVNEALTLGRGLGRDAAHAAPCDWLTVTGGAIGGGIPLATGAAVGARTMGQGDRRVINLQADGSAAYTLQALWTQARENLPVTTIILNNRSYAILLGEYAKVGAEPGKTASDMLSLDRPALDWVALAQGFGVPGRAAESVEDLRAAMEWALDREGPALIDLRFS